MHNPELSRSGNWERPANRHTLILAHRHLGIAVGLLMVLWCLPGMVMMYVPYPQLTQEERVQHLQPIDGHQCCTMGSGPIASFQAEMLGSRAVLREGARVPDLATGASLNPVAQDAAARWSTAPQLLERINYHQWRVQGGRGPDRPLLHFALKDDAGTELYVSSITGKAARLPVYRVVVGDTRFYIDPLLGEILRKVDRDNQRYRWLHQAPHRLDFSAAARLRPLWDVLTLVLLCGDTAVCVIGAWLGLRRLTGCI